MTPWDSVLEWTPPHAKWFVGGQLNVSANCVDRHLGSARRNKAAIIWEGEPGDRRVLYLLGALASEVGRAANALKALGVKKGDRVAIYLPMVPEAAIAMLACARIGAVHSVVFGGFSAEALRDRINDAEATARHHRRRRLPPRQVVPLKRFVDEALAGCPRSGTSWSCAASGGRGRRGFATMKEGRDHWWHELLDAGVARLPRRADGRRGTAVHPLYLGHHRKAEGHRAHHRRIPDPGGGDHDSTSST